MRPLARVAAIGCILPAWAQQQPAIPAEQAEVYALLDEVGFADAPQAPFVVVHVGPRQQAPPLFGELVASTKDRFTVLLLDLGRTTWAIGEDVPAERRASFEPVDPREAAREVAAALRASAEQEPMAWFSDARAPLSPETRALLLARACARRGFAAAARELHAELPPEYASKQTIASHWRFGRDLRNRRVLDHADPTLSWQDLLARYDRTIPLLRGSDRGSAQSSRDRIAALLERQETGAGDAGTEVARLLRALSAQAAPVSARFDAEPLPPRAPLADYGPDPADRVVAVGLEAVPDLIGLLRDDTPTRSVWYSTKYGGHFSVESVRDIARACLQRIAGGRPQQADEQAGWVDWYAAARDRGREAARIEVLGLPPGAKNVAEYQAAYVRERWGWQR